MKYTDDECLEWCNTLLKEFGDKQISGFNFDYKIYGVALKLKEKLEEKIVHADSCIFYPSTDGMFVKKGSSNIEHICDLTKNDIIEVSENGKTWIKADIYKNNFNYKFYYQILVYSCFTQLYIKTNKDINVRIRKINYGNKVSREYYYPSESGLCIKEVYERVCQTLPIMYVKLNTAIIPEYRHRCSENWYPIDTNFEFEIYSNHINVWGLPKGSFVRIRYVENGNELENKKVITIKEFFES